MEWQDICTNKKILVATNLYNPKSELHMLQLSVLYTNVVYYVEDYEEITFYLFPII